MYLVLTRYVSGKQLILIQYVYATEPRCILGYAYSVGINLVFTGYVTVNYLIFIRYGPDTYRVSTSYPTYMYLVHTVYVRGIYSVY